MPTSHRGGPWLTMYGLRLRSQAQEQVAIPLQSALTFASSVTLPVADGTCSVGHHSLTVLKARQHVSKMFELAYQCLMLRSSTMRVSQVELAPIQRKLPDEIMSIVLGKLGAYNLGRTQCVCKAWHHLGFNEELWAPSCLEAFQQESREATVQLMRSQYRYSLYLCTVSGDRAL